MPENATEVTAAGIARLAGVGRAAVSNWRRRYADFPQPVGGTGTSPSFALPEVEQWLRDQGKLAEVPLRERVWQGVAGHPAGPGRALIHVGCALLLVRDRPTAWVELAAAPDERMAALLPQAMEHVLTARFGPEADGVHGASAPEPADVHTAGAPDPEGVHGAGSPEPGRVHGAGSPDPGRVHAPTERDLLPSVPLLRAAAELAAGIGAGQAFEFLLGRQLDANPRQYTLTPPQLAELMVDLAEPPKDAGRAARERPVRSVLDPAAGTGALLRAVGGPADLYAQEADPALAALTALRLALAAEGPRRAAGGTHRAAPGPTVRTGDTLRADAFPELAADTVLCHPPFNERNWGHDELAYDPRWEYGLPARTESELAWVQHVLARLRDGGTAVLLMPPAAASRRSGRRIRAGLLRRGALRAVIALPAGAAPPYGIPLHLWILRKPEPGVRPAADLLLADTAGLPGTGPGHIHGPRSPARRPSGRRQGPGRRTRTVRLARRTLRRPRRLARPGRRRGGQPRRARDRTPRRRRGSGPGPPSAAPGVRRRSGRPRRGPGTPHRNAPPDRGPRPAHRRARRTRAPPAHHRRRTRPRRSAVPAQRYGGPRRYGRSRPHRARRPHRRGPDRPPAHRAGGPGRGRRRRPGPARTRRRRRARARRLHGGPGRGRFDGRGRARPQPPAPAARPGRRRPLVPRRVRPAPPTTGRPAATRPPPPARRAPPPTAPDAARRAAAVRGALP
ncbi:hypothetical protein SBADM41S_12037 [Streptomyces badius]